MTAPENRSLIPSTTASSVSSLLSDPALTPFLSPTFSPTAYLNTQLPPLLSTTTSSSSINPSNPPLSLSKLHTASTALLSTLDIHLNRLQATLSSITDEILRATPRLGYEVEVLRSDVLGMVEVVGGEKVRGLLGGLGEDEDEKEEEDGGLRKAIDEFADADIDSALASPTMRRESMILPTTTSNPSASTALPKGATTTNKKLESTPVKLKGRPEYLKRLELLARVRGHLEDVIKVFGEAMDWSLTDAQKAAGANAGGVIAGGGGLLSGYGPPSRSTSPIPGYRPTNTITSSNINASSSLLPSAIAGNTGVGTGGNGGVAGKGAKRDITSEITFLIANDQLELATEKVEELAKLCEIWKGTSEYNARVQFVEGLRWKVMEAGRVEDGSTPTLSGRGGGRRKEREREKEEEDDGRLVYTINLPEVSLGFINQFKQMRDSIGQAG